MKRVVRLVGPILVLSFFACAMWLLRRELQHYHYQDIRRGLREIPGSSIGLAAVLTVLDYVILTWHDLLATRSIGHRLPFGKRRAVSDQIDSPPLAQNRAGAMPLAWHRQSTCNCLSS